MFYLMPHIVIQICVFAETILLQFHIEDNFKNQNIEARLHKFNVALCLSHSLLLMVYNGL